MPSAISIVRDILMEQLSRHPSAFVMPGGRDPKSGVQCPELTLAESQILLQETPENLIIMPVIDNDEVLAIYAAYTIEELWKCAMATILAWRASKSESSLAFAKGMATSFHRMKPLIEERYGVKLMNIPEEDAQ